MHVYWYKCDLGLFCLFSILGIHNYKLDPLFDWKLKISDNRMLSFLVHLITSIFILP